MTTLIALRRDTEATWALVNPVLQDGEAGVERRSGLPSRMKLGDGVTAWNDLDYITAFAVVDSVNGHIGDVDLDAADVGALAIEQNLADLSDKTAARGNLGLGSAATHAAGDFDPAGFAAAAQAFAVQRSNHTGTQAPSTIADLAEFIQDTVGGMLVSGGAITLAYDDAANKLTVTAPVDPGTDQEVVRDTIGAALVGVQGVTVGINDAADTITLGISNVTISQVTGLQNALDSLTASIQANGDAITTHALRDLAVNAPGTLTAGRTNVLNATGTYTAPAPEAAVGNPPRRFAVRNESGATITLTYKDTSGNTLNLSILPGMARVYRQGSVNGYGLEDGIPMSQLVALFAATARGLPAGGTTGQRLQKVSGNDYDVAWADASGAQLDANGHLPEAQSALDSRRFSLSRRADAVSETVPRPLVNNVLQLTSGQLQFAAIPLLKGQTVSKIGFYVQTGATSPTAQWFALYGPSTATPATPALLAVTSDDTTTAWANNTAKVLSLAATFTVPADGLYYIAVMVAASTTPSLLVCSGNSAVMGNVAPMLCGRDSAHNNLTTPSTAPATATLGTAVSQLPYAWVVA